MLPSGERLGGMSLYFARIGIINENTDPRSSWLSTAMVPPCASTSALVIAKSARSEQPLPPTDSGDRFPRL
jgi:hypothetical protein